MKQAAILTGVILIVIGLIGYFGQWMEQDSSISENPTSVSPAVPDSQDKSAVDKKTKAPSPTSLIPAGFGAVILICGFLAMNESWRKHAMHAAAGIALLGGLAGLGRGIPGLIKIVNADPAINSRAVIFTWLMVAVCLGFVFLAVNSFIAARKAKTENN